MNLGIGYPLGSEDHEEQEISQTSRDRLRHTYVVGSSGSGKTAALLTWAFQDCLEDQAHGIIDVEGPFSETCLSYLEHVGIEPSRVVVVDPTRTEAVIPLNFLAPQEGVHPWVAIEELVFCMRRAWADAWGPRLDDLLRHALPLLQEFKLTLAELPRLLSDKEFRERLAKQSQDERLQLFFLGHLGNVPAREWRVWIESARNKASAFVGNPFISPMIAADRCLDLRAIMDEGKYLYVCLPERVLKDSGKLLAMMLISRIYSAALQRPEGSRPWMLYVDEFAECASRSLLSLVSRARKRSLGVILSHQNMQQPPFDRDSAFLDTVLSNCSTKVFFAVGRTDAERLAKEVFPATGTLPKTTSKKDDLWGGEKVTSFFSIQEEREHAISELENQQPRECFIKLPSGETYVASTYDLPEITGGGETLADISVRLHGVSPESIVAAQKARREAIDPKKGNGTEELPDDPWAGSP